MSFFGKLKDRLFKSSSRLEEGLDAIVAEGGESEVPDSGGQGGDLQRTDSASAEHERPQETPSKPEGGADRTFSAVERPFRTPDPEPRLADPAPPIPPDNPEEIPQPVPGEASSQDPAPPRDADSDRPRIPVPDEYSPTVEPPQKVTPPPLPNEEAAEEAPAAEARGGFFGRLLGRSPAGGQVMRRLVDDDMLESLEDLLIASDMGVDTATRVTANLAEGHYGRRLSTDEIKAVLAAEIARIMRGVATPLPLYPSKPQVVLVVGVNGSGKTTTIGKLASQFRAAGKSVVIAAGDTFRAAAVEQLQVWGDRAGVPVMTAAQGSDPASLAFDAMSRAQAEGADLLMIDTAGRLQNRADLMEELAKIVRVIRKKDPDAPHNTILVLDATTGQNALSQVDIFRRMADVTGLVMTKLDGTAKGGVLVALADKFGLPIHAIGVGEQIDDLDAFDPEEFARALTGAAA